MVDESTAATKPNPTIDQIGGWPSVIQKLVKRSDLTRDEAQIAMSEMLSGNATQAQISGAVVALAAKGESVEEMTGFVQAMLSLAMPLNVNPEAIDIVGTGGSAHGRSSSLNVSTMAAIVAASAGAVVCKHGNRRASSTSGAFDFLEELGVAIDLSPAALERCVSEVGIGFAFARTFHPGMRFVGSVRAELGVPTVFNTLGPLAHPGQLRRQVVGTTTENRAKAMASVLHALGSSNAWVVVGDNGIDELSITGPSAAYRVSQDGVVASQIDPEDYGLDRATMADIAGGSPADNAALFCAMIGVDCSQQSSVEHNAAACRQIVTLNAGAGLVVAGLAATLGDGISMANSAIDSGQTGQKMESLRDLTNQLAKNLK